MQHGSTTTSGLVIRHRKGPASQRCWDGHQPLVEGSLRCPLGIHCSCNGTQQWLSVRRRMAQDLKTNKGGLKYIYIYISSGVSTMMTGTIAGNPWFFHSFEWIHQRSRHPDLLHPFHQDTVAWSRPRAWSILHCLCSIPGMTSQLITSQDHFKPLHLGSSAGCRRQPTVFEQFHIASLLGPSLRCR